MDRVTLNFFSYIRADFIPSGIIFFLQVIIFNQKVRQFTSVHHNRLRMRPLLEALYLIA